MPYYVHEFSDGSYRSATEREIQTALTDKARREKLERQLETLTTALNLLQSECQHTVQYDEVMFPYVARHCVRCGRVIMV